VLTFQTRTLELVKRFPLSISRGTMSASENLFVHLSDGKHEGVGELSPATGREWTAKRGLDQLEEFLAGHPQVLQTAKIDPEWIDYVGSAMSVAWVDPPAMAALDVALWDLYGKQQGKPLYQLFGFEKPSIATSVTIGINAPEVTRERVPEILSSTGAKCLKIKLGSPDGRDHDRAHFLAAKESALPFGVRLRVDANGGWSAAEAPDMIEFLAKHDVDYVEQPLAEGMESFLAPLVASSPLPIYLDESCRVSADVRDLEGKCHGVNLKLMKCGGLTDALKIVREAKSRNLKLMIGCMSESSIAISAGAHLSGALDHIDLDSHLNLNPDPATGAAMVDGVVVPGDEPGHGASLRDA
jgi:L-alanine-DL-glutamate epimerase-like enolase superfamily enzyme